jgi:hypothetical protein
MKYFFIILSAGVFAGVFQLRLRYRLRQNMPELRVRLRHSGSGAQLYPALSRVEEEKMSGQRKYDLL